MIQRLHDTASGYRWDCVVMWRAVRGLEGGIFGDVPLHVVDRWACKDRDRFDGHPELQDAIGFAKGELRARREAGGRLVAGEAAGAPPARMPATEPSRD